MILLLGGTSETAPFADALARAGYRVLVSTATEISLCVGSHQNIAHRAGRLCESEMAALVQQEGIQAIVDATHPYAHEVRSVAPRVAAAMGIPYLTFIRPGVALPGETHSVSTHEEAAKLACNGSGPVLLTIGSRNLEPYVKKAALLETPVIVRVLSHSESIESCRRAGIPMERIVFGRGPFSVEDNRRVIRQFDIRSLVTKNSGAAGGMPEKLEAARLENCRVVVVNRQLQPAICGFDEMHRLIEELARRLNCEMKGRKRMWNDPETNKSCLVLIAHGSKDVAWTLPFRKLAEDLKSEYEEKKVFLVFMELSRPTLLDIAGEIVNEGISSVQVLPLFMSRGIHLAHDLPAQIEEVQARFPGLKIDLLPPIGQNPEFFDFIHKIATGYISQ